MAFTIAMAGKGGVGKTTLCGLLIKYMVTRGKRPILAVDADSNYNLNDVLGVKVSTTLGNAREDMKKGKVPAGMTKDVFMSLRLEEAIIETGDYDLIVMGQPEGAGCYCAANTLLTNYIEKLSANYPYIVIDNEAGMEHISRLTTKDVDILLIISDPTFRGIQAAIRIHQLAAGLNIGVKKSYLIINQISGNIPDGTLAMVKKNGLEFAGAIPEDKTVRDYDAEGKPFLAMPEDSRVVKAAYAIFDNFIF